LAVVGSLLTPIAGCGGGTLKVTKVAALAERPANVAVYLNVLDKRGQPVVGLTTGNFRIYEDGKLISESKAKRALLDPGGVVVRSALLLVDLSGPVVESEYLSDLAASVGRFVDKVGAGQEVAVDAFDGGDEVAPFVGFGATTDSAKIVDGVRQFRPRSRSTNLNGAVFQGLAALKEQLDKAAAQQKSGSLVIFTDRGDLAHSVNPQVLEQALKDTPVDVYVIGVGETVDRAELAAIGHSGIFISHDPKVLKKGFDQVIDKLSADNDGRYVFSYCTPKRKGEHELRLEIVIPGDSGRVSHHFDASGFKSGCSAKRHPIFGALPAAS
jgi:von Willebrand factor type A domain-containing protein